MGYYRWHKIKSMPKASFYEMDIDGLKSSDMLSNCMK